MLAILLFLATIFLAFTNGANDNFKGVATLFGSRTTNYKQAVGWAAVTTFAGSVCSIFFAQALVKNFSGKGLVPDEVSGSLIFLCAVALGAALTVMLATHRGFPISTTHGLTGALVGAGWMAAGPLVNLTQLGKTFFFPLLISPTIAVVLGGFFYIIFRNLRLSLGVNKNWCVCVGTKEMQNIPIPQPRPGVALSTLRTPEVSIAKTGDCLQYYQGNFWGISVNALLDAAHFLSAGIVGFARGLNDTPKIFALVLAVNFLNIPSGMLVVAAAMALGGLLKARKVAETMGHKITRMNQGQGFTANLVTGCLVIFASKLGVPVSTTHVSCGALFGMGLVTGRADVKMISGIVLAWVLTLPTAIVFGAVSYWVLSCAVLS